MRCRQHCAEFYLWFVPFPAQYEVKKDTRFEKQESYYIYTYIYDPCREERRLGLLFVWSISTVWMDEWIYSFVRPGWHPLGADLESHRSPRVRIVSDKVWMGTNMTHSDGRTFDTGHVGETP